MPGQGRAGTLRRRLMILRVRPASAMHAAQFEGCSVSAAELSMTCAELRRAEQPLTLPQTSLLAVTSGEHCVADEDVDDGRTSWSTSNFAAFEDDGEGWSAEPASDDGVPDDEDAWSVTAGEDGAEDDLDDLDVRTPHISVF